MDLSLVSDDGRVASLRAGPALEENDPGGGMAQLHRLLGPNAFARRVALDLSGVSRFGSGGLAWLLACTARFEHTGGRLVLHSPSEAVPDRLRSAGIDSQLHLAADEPLAWALAVAKPALALPH